MPYEIRFKKSALKEFEKLPLNLQQNLVVDIAHLADTPRPIGCKKLKGTKIFGVSETEIIALFILLKTIF